MKTSSSAPRIIHRHRPLGPDDLSQRYLRLVDAPLPEDLEVYPRNQTVLDLEREHLYADYGSYAYSDFDDAVEFAKQAIRQHLYIPTLFTLGDMLPTSLIVGDLEPEATIVQEEIELLADRIPAAELAEALVEYRMVLGERRNGTYWLPEVIEDYLSDEGNVDLVRGLVEAEPRAQRDKLLELLLLQPFWVRDLHDWHNIATDDAGRLRSLIDHLLVIYPVPECLYRMWEQETAAPHETWLQWFILTAQGASITKSASVLGWNVPAKFPHFLSLAPSHFSFEQACLFAEMKRLGIHRLDFETIAAVNWLRFVPSQDDEGQRDHQFTVTTLQWLDKHWGQRTARELNMVLNWAYHLQLEAIRWERPVFSWKGRSVAKVLEAAWEYHHLQYGGFGSFKWEHKGWDWSTMDAAGRSWTITELCSGKALQAEGAALQHCVAGYAWHCVYRRSAIFSLQCDKHRMVTIELQLPSKKIAQAKGLCNRASLPHEAKLIDQWLETIVQPNVQPTSTEWRQSA